MIFNVTCPVCGKLYKIEACEDFEIWGRVEITDTGCASVTRPSSPDFEDHLNQHITDGSFAKKQSEHWERIGDAVSRVLAYYQENA